MKTKLIKIEICFRYLFFDLINFTLNTRKNADSRDDSS